MGGGGRNKKQISSKRAKIRKSDKNSHIHIF